MVLGGGYDFSNELRGQKNFKRIANYADDNSPYSFQSNMRKLIDILQQDTSTLFHWFDFNDMKTNASKTNLLVSNEENISIEIENEVIKGTKSVKLLGVTVDNKVNFTEHIGKLCKGTSQKLHALARISKFMTLRKLKLIMNAFFESQFSNCPLVWMFHNRTLNNRINKLHERALRIVHKNSQYTFQELLDLDNSKTMHHRNLQKLAIEMYKIKNNLSPKIIQDLFPRICHTYKLRNKRVWESSNIHTVHYGTDTMLFRGPKTWEILPEALKNSNSLEEFKRKIKLWIPNKCTCRLCATFVSNLGFI